MIGPLRRFQAFVRSVGATSLALTGAALVLAGGSGFLVAQAFGLSLTTATKTVTINVSPGPPGPQGPPGQQGPAGPKGEPGDPGTAVCPTGFAYSVVVFNTIGAQRTIAVCLKT